MDFTVRTHAEAVEYFQANKEDMLALAEEFGFVIDETSEYYKLGHMMCKDGKDYDTRTGNFLTGNYHGQLKGASRMQYDFGYMEAACGK